MEKKKISLTRKVQGPAGIPPAQTVNVPGMRGQLPFKPGAPILTPVERAVWEKLGWKEGDPPPQMSDEARQIIEEAMKERALPENMADLKPPPIVNIDNLSAEKQAALRDALIQAKRTQDDASTRPFIPAGPGIGEAMALAQAAESAKSPARSNRPEDKAGADPADIPVVDDLRTAAEIETEVGVAGAAVKILNCPHCGWDLALPDEIEITSGDKQTYLASLESGERFVKSYSLMGGNLNVTFRGLTAIEAELVIRQLYLDNAAGKVNVPAEFYKKVREYRLVLSLAGVYRKNNPQSELPEFENGYEVDFTNENTTGLPELLEHITKTVIFTETVKRVLLIAHEKFDTLVSKIETHAEDPDFFSVTAAAA